MEDTGQPTPLLFISNEQPISLPRGYWVNARAGKVMYQMISGVWQESRFSPEEIRQYARDHEWRISDHAPVIPKDYGAF